MADFFQNGVITTLNKLGPENLEGLERQLRRFTEVSPTTLILPSLYSELEGPALARMVETLAGVDYLDEIVVVLDRADAAQFEHAGEFFAPLTNCNILWLDGPRVRSIFNLLQENEIEVDIPGKGRAVWTAFGYALGRRRAENIVLHDCDILTYDRAFLARLCYPIANPNFDYEFAKGFYARASDQLYGRAARLLVGPLIRALRQLAGYHPFLEYLESFRYPLAGEMAIKAELARINRIPMDWGLEVGVLAEVFRNCSTRRVCQVELCDLYDHKHQDLSVGEPERGLFRMSIDVTKSLLHTLASEGVSFVAGFVRSLTAAYLRAAQDAIVHYHAVAAMNGFTFDRHAEETATEVFVQGIKIACERFLEDPLGTPQAPNWNRVAAAVPGIVSELVEAVRADNAALAEAPKEG
ncbi:MAG: glycosyl transferase [Nitrospinota bacterium]